MGFPPCRYIHSNVSNRYLLAERLGAELKMECHTKIIRKNYRQSIQNGGWATPWLPTKRAERFGEALQFITARTRMDSFSAHFLQPLRLPLARLALIGIFLNHHNEGTQVGC